VVSQNRIEGVDACATAATAILGPTGGQRSAAARRQIFAPSGRANVVVAKT
jgi:hypothetical protein